MAGSWFIPSQFLLQNQKRIEKPLCEKHNGMEPILIANRHAISSIWETAWLFNSDGH
jgi:hypothetical protein